MLKWKYYLINKSPWPCLDENEAFFTTVDSAVNLLPKATKPVVGWKGVEYKAAFPSFYPPDMDKMFLQESNQVLMILLSINQVLIIILQEKNQLS